MAGKKAPRSSIQHFLNTGTTETPEWNRLGFAVSSGEINYNTETEETADITMDNKVTDITGYNRNFPIEGVVLPGDPVFEFVDDLRINMRVLDDLRTDLVNVWAYKTPTVTVTEDEPPVEVKTWPAERVPVNVGIDSIGGEGAASAKIKYTLYDAGPPVIGTFNPETKVFTAAGG